MLFSIYLPIAGSFSLNTVIKSRTSQHIPIRLGTMNWVLLTHLDSGLSFPAAQRWAQGSGGPSQEILGSR